MSENSSTKHSMAKTLIKWFSKGERECFEISGDSAAPPRTLRTLT